MEPAPQEHTTEAVETYAAATRDRIQRAEKVMHGGDGGAGAAAAAAPRAMEMMEDWRKRCRSVEPLDFSFSGVGTWAELGQKQPNPPRHASSRPSTSQSSRSRRARTPGSVAGLRESQYACDLSVVTSLRLNNNRLTQVDGLLPWALPLLEPFHSVKQVRRRPCFRPFLLPPEK